MNPLEWASRQEPVALVGPAILLLCALYACGALSVWATQRLTSSAGHLLWPEMSPLAQAVLDVLENSTLSVGREMVCGGKCQVQFPGTTYDKGHVLIDGRETRDLFTRRELRRIFRVARQRSRELIAAASEHRKEELLQLLGRKT
jgi:uncharacterized membrane protein